MIGLFIFVAFLVAYIKSDKLWIGLLAGTGVGLVMMFIAHDLETYVN